MQSADSWMLSGDHDVAFFVILALFLCSKLFNMCASLINLKIHCIFVKYIADVVIYN